MPESSRPDPHFLQMFEDGFRPNISPGKSMLACRYGCGMACFHEAPNEHGPNETFREVVQRRLSRRDLLKGAAAGAGMLVLAESGLAGGLMGGAGSAEAAPFQHVGFRPIGPNTNDGITVPSDYEAHTLIRWGDALWPGFQDLSSDRGSLNQTAVLQEMRFGYNNDFLGYFPLPLGSNSSNSGILAVNHEYTIPGLMFQQYDARNPDRSQAEVELAAHGMAMVEIELKDGIWSYTVGSRYNRRITATTPMTLTGPAAGHEWLRTSADTTGRAVLGTLNNCAGGKTPWGTVLTGEENFNQYFANLSNLSSSDPRRAIHTRYGLTPGASERLWERFWPRFDIPSEPNECFRHGWVVEIDPYDPSFTPRKRTALGRFKHEGATSVLAKDGRVVIYMGDDERFDYIYKFVTSGRYNASSRAANMNLLDSGTLYVAKFNEDGSGVWIPLVFGQGALTAANGFRNQGDILINTRGAGDAVGATKMDRPEDVEYNVPAGKAYALMTNNTNRTAAQIDRANPRASNRHGHVIEWEEADKDPASLTFRWNIFLIAGDPRSEGDTYFAGFPTEQVSPISCPDNLVFDNQGIMWIATDGMPGTLRFHDAVYAVAVSGPERGQLKMFASGPIGAEICGPEFTPDNTTLFIAIQHPGESSTAPTLANATTNWPSGDMPRPAVVAIRNKYGNVIGA